MKSFSNAKKSFMKRLTKIKKRIKFNKRFKI